MTIDFIGSQGKEFTESPGRERNKPDIPTATGSGAISVLWQWFYFTRLDGIESLDGYSLARMTEQTFDIVSGDFTAQRSLEYRIPQITGQPVGTVIQSSGPIDNEINRILNIEGGIFSEVSRSTIQLIMDVLVTGIQRGRITIDLLEPLEFQDNFDSFIDGATSLNNYPDSNSRTDHYSVNDSFSPTFQSSANSQHPQSILLGATTPGKLGISQSGSGSSEHHFMNVDYYRVDLAFQKKRFLLGNYADWAIRYEGNFLVQEELSCSLPSFAEILIPPGANGNRLGLDDSLTGSDFISQSNGLVAGGSSIGIAFSRYAFPPQTNPDPLITYYSRPSNLRPTCAPWV